MVAFIRIVKKTPTGKFRPRMSWFRVILQMELRCEHISPVSLINGDDHVTGTTFEWRDVTVDDAVAGHIGAILVRASDEA